VMLSACGSSKFVGRPGLEFSANGPLPAPLREDYAIPAQPYAIGPSDQLGVDVFGVPELSRTVTVDQAGQISLPLAGTLSVSGLTSPEVADVIAARLRGNYVKDPRVTVNISTALSATFTVDGAVASPGLYALNGQMSLMRAIARASGTSEFARENHVVVFRNSGGKKYAGLYDLRAIREGMYEDPQIFSNDVILVGESQARRLFKDILAASPLITTPIITLLR
jgi:polysaccharide export outer membrane protein